MRFLRRSLIALFALSAGGATCAAPPVSAYMKRPDVETLTISPGGRFLALTRRETDHELLTLLRYPQNKASGTLHFGDQIDIYRLHWANDTRLLIEPARRASGYRPLEVSTGQIIGVDVNTRRSERLFGVAPSELRTGSILVKRDTTDPWAAVVDFPRDDPQWALIRLSDELQRMHIGTGQVARYAPSPVRRGEFVTDSQHRPLFASAVNAQGEFETHRFDPADRTWQLVTTSNDARRRIEPLEESATPGELIAIDSVNPSTSAVVAWNPQTGERRVLFQSPISDVYLLGRDPDNHAWLFGYDDHVPQYWYPAADHPLARAHAALRARFGDANVWFTSQTRDLSFAVAKVSAPRIPTAFYLVDVKNAKLLEMLPAYPQLKPGDLSPTDPVEVTVRDGTKMRGYLTRPGGASDRKLPTIVRLHGGPHGHDRYDFDPEVQLLASRGYAVLQLNFRGSGGRGRDFEGAGGWGPETQDDITDGVRWAIAAGIADRERICIYGDHVGAYAALNGASREPELFRCAVGIAGIYDLSLLFASAKEADIEALRQHSPVYNAAKIRARVMLIHLDNDGQAPAEHTARMRNALQQTGNVPVWISEGGEEPGVRAATRRLETYEQMLAFFARHLATRIESRQ